jgi:uncharacterized protein
LKFLNPKAPSMPEYQTPGVYYERLDAAAPGIQIIRTDIAGFVGIAQRGPLHRPVPIESWRQFQSCFGEVVGVGYLAYTVRAFFENGGRRCWVVRVASEAAAAAEVVLFDRYGNQIWRLAAFSPGVWGNDLDITILETHRAQTRTDPEKNNSPAYSTVESVAGFARGTHVRLKQGAITHWKVISDTDAGEKNLAGEKRLIWVHDQAERQRHYWRAKDSKAWRSYEDTPLRGFDPNLPILIESVEYTLLVRKLGRLVRVYEGISLIPDHERYGPHFLSGVELFRDSAALRRLAKAPEPVVITELRDPEAPPTRWLEPLAVSANSAIPLAGGTDGLAMLQVKDFIGEEVSALDCDLVRQRKLRGLRTLEEIGEVAMVAVPDIHIRPLLIPPKSLLPSCIPDPCLPSGPPLPAVPRMPSQGDLPPVFSEADIFQVQSELVQQCEKRRDRIALLDPPYATVCDAGLGVAAVRAWRSRFDSTYAAFYYPWLRVMEPLAGAAESTRAIPPSGHVAGQYAQTDFQVGVHKAPANAPLIWVQDVTIAVNASVHGILNPAGINVIRPLMGRGIRIYGARTVSSDSDWRFVNVRRLLMMIEKAIYLAIQWAVFEPNDMFTRAKLHLSLTSFLLSLWQQGALMGATADEAFFIKCDEQNNPAGARDNGRLLAEVGVAPSQPFEFVILRIGRAHNEFEITEAMTSRGVG